MTFACRRFEVVIGFTEGKLACQEFLVKMKYAEIVPSVKVTLLSRFFECLYTFLQVSSDLAKLKQLDRISFEHIRRNEVYYSNSIKSMRIRLRHLKKLQCFCHINITTETEHV